MGCSASVAVTIDATDVRKPADVACGKCGEVTYLDAGKETSRCFNWLGGGQSGGDGDARRLDG